MFRLRRYRGFIVFALIVVGLLYHFSSSDGLDALEKTAFNRPQGSSPAVEADSATTPKEKSTPPDSTLPSVGAVSNLGPSKIQSGHHDALGEDEDEDILAVPLAAGVATAASKGAAGPVPTVRKNAGSVADQEEANPKGHPQPDTALGAFVSAGTLDSPGSEPSRASLKSSSTTRGIHWTPSPEHFPVPSGSLISLPTAAAKVIPKIQHKFDQETVAEKRERQQKLDKITQVFQHSWSGYREKAWLHDELKPKSGGFRDTFCGWGATLVDSLDTLWIMGLKEEFEEAVDALKEIDFTTTQRNDIPLFETVIRYLGGFLGAYDLSGGKYRILLDKAVELAEILMGAFDTPNRMPLTYYQWKPAFASQPHRAKTNVVMSELGSLSLEFTRLAQITKEKKYYDAIARITNEMEIMQSQTKVPGLWPQMLDVSGCKKVERMKPVSPAQDDAAQDPLGGTGGGQAKGLQKRLPMDDQMDCEAQGITSPPGAHSETFGIGALADSTYEYLPKMHMLLGGVVSQYKDMYEMAADALIDSVLFRAMIPDESRIILSAGLLRASPSGDYNKVDTHLEAEGSHLTCFVGGMFAVGAKVFGRAEDLDRAKQLTDGCVWAYESTVTGVMPEIFEYSKCNSTAKCPWDRVQWEEHVDTQWHQRDEQRIKQDEFMRKQDGKPLPSYENVDEVSGVADEASGSKEIKKSSESSSKSSVTGGQSRKDGLKKRQLDEDEVVLAVAGSASKGDAAAGPKEIASSAVPSSTSSASTFKIEESTGTMSESSKPEEARSAGHSASSKTEDKVEARGFVDDQYQPPSIVTHDEYMQARLEKEHLPIGMVRVNDKKYILRPEAIESVFIMYRITGDQYWQEKGWKMFEAVVKLTETAFGASGVNNVLNKETTMKDEMESFWLAETLKYYYLLFSDPELVSLDEYVL